MNGVEGASGGAVCLPDNRPGRQGRHICAVETDLLIRTNNQDYILVAGFDHEPDDVRFDKIQCPEFPEGHFGQTAVDSNGEPFTRTSAAMVTDRESLVDYLKSVDEQLTNDAAAIYRLLPPDLPQGLRGGLVYSAWTRSRYCWRQEPWTSGQIYFYLVTFTDKLFGFFNGLNAEFEDSTLRLYDGCIDYGTTVRNVLDQEGVTDGFITYYWSDPTDPDDLVVDDSGNPIRGLSPGTSVKDGYFLQTNFSGLLRFSFVLGSGIYPDEEYYEPEGGMCQDIPDDLSLFARGYLDEFPDFMDQEQPEQPESPQQDDDGGCAIASSDEGNLKATGFSFLLIAVFMFFGVFGKKVLRTEELRLGSSEVN